MLLCLLERKFHYEFRLFPSWLPSLSFSLGVASGLAGQPVPHDMNRINTASPSTDGCKDSCSMKAPPPPPVRERLSQVSHSYRPENSSGNRGRWREVKVFIRGSESCWSVIIHGGCTTVFSLSGHREDSDSGCFGFPGSGDYKWSYWAECYWELKMHLSALLHMCNIWPLVF